MEGHRPSAWMERTTTGGSQRALQLPSFCFLLKMTLALLYPSPAFFWSVYWFLPWGRVNRSYSWDQGNTRMGVETNQHGRFSLSGGRSCGGEGEDENNPTVLEWSWKSWCELRVFITFIYINTETDVCVVCMQIETSREVHTHAHF